MIHLANIAKNVTISRNKPKKETIEERNKRENALPPQTVMKDNVDHFTANGAEFIDGTTQTFNTVIYATGEFLNLQFQFVS